MHPSCVICDEPTSVRVIGSMVPIGDADRPDGGVVCRRCTALSATERQRRRERAMTRRLFDAMIAETATRRRPASAPS